MSYNSHTSQHAEGFGVAMTLPIRFQVIVLDHIALPVLIEQRTVLKDYLYSHSRVRP